MSNSELALSTTRASRLTLTCLQTWLHATMEQNVVQEDGLDFAGSSMRKFEARSLDSCLTYSMLKRDKKRRERTWSRRREVRYSVRHSRPTETVLTSARQNLLQSYENDFFDNFVQSLLCNFSTEKRRFR